MNLWLKRASLAGVLLMAAGVLLALIGYWAGADVARALNVHPAVLGMAGADGTVFAEPQPAHREWPSASSVEIDGLDEAVRIERGGEAVVLDYSEWYGGQYVLEMQNERLRISRVRERKETGDGVRWLVIRALRQDHAPPRGSPGPIRLTLPDGVVLQRIAINTVSGPIELQSVSCDALNVNTVSGSVTMANVDCRKTRLYTVSGAITVTEDAAIPEASARSGEGEPESPPKLDALYLRTVSGDMTLGLAHPGSYRIRFTGVSGSLSVLGRSRGKNVLLNGTARSSIQIDTVSGSARIQAAAPVDGASD